MPDKSIIGFGLIAFMLCILALIFTASHSREWLAAFQTLQASSADQNQKDQGSSTITVQSVGTKKITRVKHPKVDVPDFGQFKNVKKKKKAFFNYFRPIIQKENQALEQQRKKLLEISKSFQKDKQISTEQYAFLEKLTHHYDIEPTAPLPEQINTLLNRVNTIPESLVLAQAANESGWGSSRFALEAYNFFGEWCFKKGCGLIPQERTGDEIHEVKKFRTPADSVRSYFKNINTHWAYKDLRKLRRNMTEKQEPLSGYWLAQGLSSYSQRGQHYIDELRAMIRVNKLEDVHLIRKYENIIRTERQKREQALLAEQKASAKKQAPSPLAEPTPIDQSESAGLEADTTNNDTPTNDVLHEAYSH